MKKSISTEAAPAAIGLSDMNDFAAMNEAYAAFFAEGDAPCALRRGGCAPAKGRARGN